MDIDMDVDFDAGAGIEAGAQQTVQAVGADEPDTAMPAAYFENLDARPVDPWPEYLNVQGVNDFDPNDPLYYAMEHCPEPRVKQLRWVNDSSVNLQYYSAQDAILALQALTDPQAGDPTSIPAQTGRKARPYSKKADSVLIIRQANAGDQKARGAANRSHFYKHNPDVRGDRGDRGREREPRRRPPPRRDYLDYDGVDPRDTREPRERRRRSASGDEHMRDDSDFESRRYRRNGNRERGGGRLQSDVDSYRPGSKSPRESRFGRLRGRSASPVSGDEGDGRYGFTEEGMSTSRRYRSRSRSRNPRRRREPSGERWTHDRAGFGDRDHSSPGGKWGKDTSALRYSDTFSEMSKHRRSDATDETANSRKGSLLSRMTKDGQPLAPQGRSLASRITRDDDDEPSYGRLRNDFSAVRETDFSEPAPKRGLASRITRDDDDIQIRGQSRPEQTEGINIRGTAAQQGGFSIRGVAGGA